MERSEIRDRPSVAGRGPRLRGDGDLRPALDCARMTPILAAANSRRGSMRTARAAFRNRRLWAGLALGGAPAAAVALGLNRASEAGEAKAPRSRPRPSR